MMTQIRGNAGRFRVRGGIFLKRKKVGGIRHPPFIEFPNEARAWNEETQLFDPLPVRDCIFKCVREGDKLTIHKCLSCGGLISDDPIVGVCAGCGEPMSKIVILIEAPDTEVEIQYEGEGMESE